ncbi:hypothetical protein [Paraburkholderia sp. JHI869]|uniref:hypothetical protein n=1 Tax=Paraburkholderia sp. JHI869 TaxID=3112959 RepID=UPI00319E3B5D
MANISERSGAVTSLTVQAAAGQLRIVPVWQAIGPYAAYARRARVHCSSKHNVDEVTVIFVAVSTSDLKEVAWRLNAQSWVVATLLHVFPDDSTVAG